MWLQTSIGHLLAYFQLSTLIVHGFSSLFPKNNISLNVSSVIYITERINILSIFFLMPSQSNLTAVIVSIDLVRVFGKTCLTKTKCVAYW